MIRYTLFFLLSLYAFAAVELNPIANIEINGTAKDMVLVDNQLVVATDMGHIEIYDATTREKQKEISIPDVKDFMGDLLPARVMSADTLNGKYLLCGIFSVPN